MRHATRVPSGPGRRWWRDRRAGIGALALPLVLAAPSLAGSQAPAIVALRLTKVVVEVPSRDRLLLFLGASPMSEATSRAYTHGRLFVGPVEIPLVRPGTSTDQPGSTIVHLEVDLGKVPASVLTLPVDVLSMRWEGTTDGGKTVVTVAGDISPGDPSQLVLPTRKLYETYARLDDVSLAPADGGLAFHALLSLYNPFSFDIVASGLDYEVTAGDATVLSTAKPGFRLRAAGSTDVLLEETVPLEDAAAAAMAMIRGSAVGLSGQLSLRTPDGERVIPLQLGSGR